jgi:hypothetical protein
MKKSLALALCCSLYAPIFAMFPDLTQFYTNTKPSQTIATKTSQKCKDWAASIAKQAQNIKWTNAHIAEASLIAAITAGAAYGIHALFLPTNNSLLIKSQQALDLAKIYENIYAKLQSHTKKSLEDLIDPLELDESTLEDIASAYENNVAENIENTIKTLNYYNEFLKIRMNFAKTLATLHINADNNNNMFNKMFELHNQLESFLINLEFIEVFTTRYHEYFELYAKIQGIKRMYATDSIKLVISARTISDEYPCMALASNIKKEFEQLNNLQKKIGTHYPILNQQAAQVIDMLAQQKDIVLESDTYKQELYNQQQYKWYILKQQLARSAEILVKDQQSSATQQQVIGSNLFCIPGL